MGRPFFCLAKLRTRLYHCNGKLCLCVHLLDRDGYDGFKDALDEIYEFVLWNKKTPPERGFNV
jgi:hypothetical protein